MPPKTKKRVAKKSLVCWNKEGKTICAGKSTFSNYKPRKKKKVVKKPVVEKAVKTATVASTRYSIHKKAVVKKPVVKKAVVKKPVVKKAVVKKATKAGFTKAKQKMLDTIPLTIEGTGMMTMSYDEAVKAIKKVKKEGDWKGQFKKIRAKIDESAKMYS